MKLGVLNKSQTFPFYRSNVFPFRIDWQYCMSLSSNYISRSIGRFVVICHSFLRSELCLFCLAQLVCVNILCSENCYWLSWSITGKLPELKILSTVLKEIHVILHKFQYYIIFSCWTNYVNLDYSTICFNKITIIKQTVTQ